MPIRPEMKSRYPADWPAIRERIKARAGNRCEWCGVANYASLPMRCCADPAITDGDVNHCASCGKRVPKVVLTTAHVHDDDPANCEDDNLAFLCQRCHNRHDAKGRTAGIAQRRRERDLKRQPLLPIGEPI